MKEKWTGRRNYFGTCWSRPMVKPLVRRGMQTFCRLASDWPYVEYNTRRAVSHSRRGVTAMWNRGEPQRCAWHFEWQYAANFILWKRVVNGKDQAATAAGALWQTVHVDHSPESNPLHLGRCGLIQLADGLSSWETNAILRVSQSRWTLYGHIDKKAMLILPPKALLGAAWSLTASGGHGFICLLWWNEDHPLGTRNAASQSEVTSCAPVCQLGQQSLLQTWKKPTLTLSHILLEFCIKMNGIIR